MTPLSTVSIHINGIVQGVGFRPFVYNLALQHNLKGWVCNTSDGVDIEATSTQETLKNFIHDLETQAPPLSLVDDISVSWHSHKDFDGFEIIPSHDKPGAFIPLSPDVTICEDCLQELFTPQDFRYRYPFINCTNCGPRFTIIKDIPYDRPFTTMSPFEMCETCAAEYFDPANRRFHAQPVACPTCGPHIWLEIDNQIIQEKEAALSEARAMLKAGKILAVKGLGGFHLACDATNEQAVAELRARKLRIDKPFAVMMPDTETIRAFCHFTPSEKALLESRPRPIVILDNLPDTKISPSIAPNQSSLGVMLPYTPLHYLLLEKEPGFPTALVMTSANYSEEPIASTNEQARIKLSDLADGFLMNDRDIHIRCDDSVVRANPVVQKGENPAYLIRRSRGYAPQPVFLAWESPPILGTGAELKNTFCLSKDKYAFLSHHIGDLENYETLTSFETGIEHFGSLFRIQPEAIAYDLHPNYTATRYALDRIERESLPSLGIQHHHAHIAACMAEHKLPGDNPVIGVAFDGTGYGTDQTIWGGEFLIADYKTFSRPYHLAPFPLPGGDAATKEPWRIALSLLSHASIEWDNSLPSVQHPPPEILSILRNQLDKNINAPLTSSMGRLFDGIAALAGVRQTVNYEAQAAIELESQVDPSEEGLYPFDIHGSNIDFTPMINNILSDIQKGTSTPTIAARFHNSISNMILNVCNQIKKETGLTEVALSGGVWQNITLLHTTVPLLKNAGFEVYVHHKVPANDGGLSLGQIAIAYHSLYRS